MTRDQNGTWEMESNDNFEGYMKALGKEETRGEGRRGTLGELWSSPPDSATMEFNRSVCKPRSFFASYVIIGKSYKFSVKLRFLISKLGIIVSEIMSEMSLA